MANLYTITTAKEIHCLGDITGPVTTPVKLEKADVISLLKNGYTLYQVNPYDYNDKVLVTRSNINTIEFSRSRADVTKEKIQNRSSQEMTKPVTTFVKNQSIKDKNATNDGEIKNNKVTLSSNSATPKNNKKSEESENSNAIKTPDDFKK